MLWKYQISYLKYFTNCSGSNVKIENIWILNPLSFESKINTFFVTRSPGYLGPKTLTNTFAICIYWYIVIFVILNIIKYSLFYLYMHQKSYWNYTRIWPKLNCACACDQQTYASGFLWTSTLHGRTNLSLKDLWCDTNSIIYGSVEFECDLLDCLLIMDSRDSFPCLMDSMEKFERRIN